MANIVVAQADTHGTEAGAHDAGDAAHAAADTHEGTVAHGDGGHAAFPPFDAATFPSQLLWLAITFAALYLLMSRVALPRIGEILETRRDRIEGDLAEAERMRVKTDQALADYEAALSAAKTKAQGIAEATRTRVKSDLDARRNEIETDLSGKVSEAEARIQATKSEALKSVGEIAAETAQALVAQLTGEVSDKDAKDAVAKAMKESA